MNCELTFMISQPSRLIIVLVLVGRIMVLVIVVAVPTYITSCMETTCLATRNDILTDRRTDQMLDPC